MLCAHAVATADWASQFVALTAFSGRVLLSATFLYAGVQKIRHHGLLAGVISQYKVLPEALAPWVAWLLPPAELILAGALLIPSAASALAAACLLLLFTAAIIINLARGRTHIDCGCFQSGLRQEIGWELIWRNATLVGIAVYSACFPRPLSWDIGVAAVLFGLLTYTFSQALQALGANRSALRSLAAR
jgi:uncharacterized membrane protein YphA (DoxX/SURF4 family)